MDLYEVIEKRRSIRVCKKGATEEQLRKIILAGTKAPSAVNRQPWEFIIVEDPDIIDQLAELKYQLNIKKDPDRGDKTDEERATLFDTYAERQSDNASTAVDQTDRRFFAAQARYWRKLAYDLRRGKNVYNKR